MTTRMMKIPTKREFRKHKTVNKRNGWCIYDIFPLSKELEIVKWFNSNTDGKEGKSHSPRA